jgi:hypothetical protein
MKASILYANFYRDAFQEVKEIFVAFSNCSICRYGSIANDEHQPPETRRPNPARSISNILRRVSGRLNAFVKITFLSCFLSLLPASCLCFLLLALFFASCLASFFDFLSCFLFLLLVSLSCFLSFFVIACF